MASLALFALDALFKIGGSFENMLFFQDILGFRGTILELENFNEAGRGKLAALRKCIERLDDWANDEGDAVIAKEVDSHRQQFSR